MSRSVLLQLARDSIEEVFHAELSIHRSELLNKHPLLGEKIKTTIHLFVEKELYGSYTSDIQESSLLENIIQGAKKAAFEDTQSKILTTSLYLNCEIELILETPEGIISEIDPPIIHPLSSL